MLGCEVGRGGFLKQRAFVVPKYLGQKNNNNIRLNSLIFSGGGGGGVGFKDAPFMK